MVVVRWQEKLMASIQKNMEFVISLVQESRHPLIFVKIFSRLNLDKRESFSFSGFR